MSIGRAALLFPGQGSIAVGMGRDLYDRSPAAKKILDDAAAVAGFDLLKLCFEGPAETLTLTEFQQPAVLAVGLAAYAAVCESVSFQPILAIGHSLGEYSALVAAGALRLADAIPLVRKRGAYMQEAVPAGVGTMAALLGADAALAEDICREAGVGVWVANLNGGGQVVISGAVAAVENARRIAKGKGIRRTVLLPVSAPFHCPLMAPAADRLAADLAETSFGDFAFPVVANFDAQPNGDSSRVNKLLFNQVTGRVRFEECVREAVAHKPDFFVEFGIGARLKGLVERITADVPCYCVAGFDDVMALKTLSVRA